MDLQPVLFHFYSFLLLTSLLPQARLFICLYLPLVFWVYFALTPQCITMIAHLTSSLTSKPWLVTIAFIGPGVTSNNRAHLRYNPLYQLAFLHNKSSQNLADLNFIQLLILFFPRSSKIHLSLSLCHFSILCIKSECNFAFQTWASGMNNSRITFLSVRNFSRE